VLNRISNLARSEGDPKVVRTGPSSLPAEDRIAKGLGWFSIGLGLTELFMAPQLTRALGMRGQEPLVRAFGAREITAGVLTLSVDKSLGLWSRLAGDGLAIAMLASATRNGNPKRNNAALALAMVVGVTALDCIGAKALSARHARRGPPRLYRDRSGFPQGLEAARGAARNGGGRTPEPDAGAAITGG
jgi:hypothetical protein